jgi:signal transduction histidine kinase
LKIGQRLFGTFSFVSLFRDRFSPEDLAMITTLCDLVSAATDRKRLLVEAGSEREIAEKANAAKDDFLAALSHELRTPLNPVLLLATAAAADPEVPAELRADFDIIVRNVLLEARLIDDLLDSTRIARGKLVLEMLPLLVNDVLKEAIANVQNELDGKHLILKIDLDPANPSVKGDAMRLQQIFWNVLKNALKFTPNGGEISIRTSIDEPRRLILVDITDTGVGMTPAELERIFEAFKQGDHAGRGGSKKFGGLGLGLAIARTLAELHSGSVRATSDGIGRGSRFTIELPLHAAETVKGLTSSPALEDAVTGTVPARCEGLRILLVDDHGPTRAALAQLLSRRKHEVSTAGTIAEARQLGIAETFDLLITDIGLPDGSGYELMEELGRVKNLKGIAMTGYGMDGDIERSAKVGFSAHLTKPVKMQSLDNAIIAAMKATDRE